MGGSGLEISIFNVKCRLNGGKIREEIWYPGYPTGGKKPVPFEEYIPLQCPQDVSSSPTGPPSSKMRSAQITLSRPELSAAASAALLTTAYNIAKSNRLSRCRVALITVKVRNSNRANYKKQTCLAKGAKILNDDFCHPGPLPHGGDNSREGGLWITCLHGYLRR